MRPSVRVLLADARAGRGEDAGPGVPPGAGVGRGIYRRDGKQILERIEDQRTCREWLVTHVTQREGRGRTQRPRADHRRAPREEAQLEQLSSVQSKWFSRSHLSFLLSLCLLAGRVVTGPKAARPPSGLPPRSPPLMGIQIQERADRRELLGREAISADG